MKKNIDNFAVAITSVVGDKPSETLAVGRDHRQHEYPYLSKFKTEELAAMKMKKCVTLNNYCNIKDLVTHIYKESKRMFKGTNCKDSWYFYHDALSIMTSASTRE